MAGRLADAMWPGQGTAEPVDLLWRLRDSGVRLAFGHVPVIRRLEVRRGRGVAELIGAAAGRFEHSSRHQSAGFRTCFARLRVLFAKFR